MRKIFLLTALAAATFSSATVNASQVLSGKWGGRSPTTLEFLENSQVKYCYKTKCTTQSYTGDKDKKIKFKWGRSKFTFTKTESGYDGTFLRILTSKVKIK